MLKFLEGIMSRGDQLPPILASVIEAHPSIRILSRIQLTIGCQAVVIDALHYKVLVGKIMRMIGVSRMRLNLNIGAGAARTQ